MLRWKGPDKFFRAVGWVMMMLLFWVLARHHSSIRHFIPFALELKFMCFIFPWVAVQSRDIYIVINLYTSIMSLWLIICFRNFESCNGPNEICFYLPRMHWLWCVRIYDCWIREKKSVKIVLRDEITYCWNGKVEWLTGHLAKSERWKSPIVFTRLRLEWLFLLGCSCYGYSSNREVIIREWSLIPWGCNVVSENPSVNRFSDEKSLCKCLAVSYLLNVWRRFLWVTVEIGVIFLCTELTRNWSGTVNEHPEFCRRRLGESVTEDVESNSYPSDWWVIQLVIVEWCNGVWYCQLCLSSN